MLYYFAKSKGALKRTVSMKVLNANHERTTLSYEPIMFNRFHLFTKVKLIISSDW